jgi:hypothetical protein
MPSARDRLGVQKPKTYMLLTLVVDTSVHGKANEQVDLDIRIRKFLEGNG